MATSATLTNPNRRESGTRQSIVDIGTPDHGRFLYLARKASTPVELSRNFLQEIQDASSSAGEVLSISELLQQRYDKEGHITVTGIFSATHVRKALDSLTELCAGNNEGFRKAVKESYDAAARGTLDYKDGQHHAFVQYEKGTSIAGLNGGSSAALTAEIGHKVRKAMGFCSHDPVLNGIATHPALLALLKILLRVPENAELELFQDMALLKGVGGREKPYHQDHAYFNLPLNSKVVGVWMALDEASEENGCMRCIPGLHRRSTAERLGSDDVAELLAGSKAANASQLQKESVAPGEAPEYAFTDIDDELPLWHYMKRDFQLCDDLPLRFSDYITSCPLPPGGVMVFDSKLPHGTPTNRSNSRRRALQFHYAVKGVPRVPESTRLQSFGGEGSGVEC